MRYSDLPESILNKVIDEDGWPSAATLRNEIDQSLDYCGDERVLEYEYELDAEDKIKTFKMWSKNFVFVLFQPIFGGGTLVALPRNPPKGKYV